MSRLCLESTPKKQKKIQCSPSPAVIALERSH